MSCVAIKDYPDTTFSGFLKRLRPKQDHITYHKYLAFYLRSKYFRETMSNNSIMTLRASLNEQIFSYLKLLLPEYSCQVKIGDLLFLLSEKIELNNKINAELKSMAKTLYDYWFVQFDFPDENGKPYKSSGGKMVYNERLHREAPEGWEVGRLNDIISLEYGKPLKQDARSGSGYPVLGSNGVVGYHEEFLIKGPGIVVGRKGSAGEVVRIGESFYPIDTTYYVLDRIGVGDLHFHHQFLIRCNLKSIESSSAVPGLNRNVAHLIPSIIPPVKLIEEYNKFIGTVYAKFDSNCKQNQELANLRDWLLPMLMNGQVSVGEAEEMVERKGEQTKSKNAALGKAV